VGREGDAMGKYDDAIKADKPDFYEPFDSIPHQPRSRADIFEAIAFVGVESRDDESAAVGFAVLEVLLDIRDLLSTKEQGK
jgi:hypothetical protein